MAKKNNRKCLCCSTPYRYCNTCSEDKGKPAWMASFHDENCMKLFMGATDYVAGDISLSQAKKIVNAADLTHISAFKPSVQKFVKDVQDAKIDSVSTPVFTPVDNTTSTTSDTQPKTDDKTSKVFGVKKNDKTK